MLEKKIDHQFPSNNVQFKVNAVIKAEVSLKKSVPRRLKKTKYLAGRDLATFQRHQVDVA